MRIVCILGMHRSGTSCLAGSLEESGLYLGDVNTAAQHNAKGNRELERIWRLHEAILDHSGGSWSRPPDTVVWTDTHRAERDAILRHHAPYPVWGFKDPRTLLALPFWRETVSGFAFVGTFRHPMLVAESLYRREGRDIAAWLDVWARYNTRLLAEYRTAPFPVIRFDTGEAAYRRALSAVIVRLGLTAPTTPRFFDPGLRHRETEVDRGLPDGVATLYRSLCDIAFDTSAVQSIGGDADAG